MIIFSIWTLCGLAAIGLGIYVFNSDKAINFWANIRTTEEVSDVQSYNKAVAKVLWAFGIIFIILGLPLLSEQNSYLIIFSIPGIMFDTIFLMAMLRKFEIKYRKL